MGKGLRSKSKRRNRNEFRNSIGQDAAEKVMSTVQEKLQQCVEKGSMNSFERLSKILGGDSNSNNNSDNEMDHDGIKLKSPQSKSSIVTGKPLVGKNPDKLPTVKQSIVKRSKIRGQKKGVRVVKRTSSKKKREKEMCSF